MEKTLWLTPAGKTRMVPVSTVETYRAEREEARAQAFDRALARWQDEEAERRLFWRSRFGIRLPSE